MPELRKNPVTREWVIVAETRSDRPREITPPRETAVSEGPAFDPDCPFCPGNEAQTPGEVLAFRTTPGAGDTPGWNVRVTPNKYPALLVEGELARRGLGMYDCMNGIGAHEVIIETPEHNLPFADLPTTHCADVFWACRERFVDLSRDRRFKYILFFRNEGRVAGVSLSHPHSQIIALPMVPMDVMAEIEGMNHYAEYRDRCPYCDMVEQERDSGDRIVFETDTHLVFEPFASRFAFETWVVPKQHQPSFAELDYEAMPSVAEAVQGALHRIDRCLDNPPYNLAMHTMPINTSRPEDFHWHIQITPRLSATGGFELGTGVYINPLSPEESARRLRESTAARR